MFSLLLLSFSSLFLVLLSFSFVTITLKLLGLKERTFWRLFTQMTASFVGLVFKESARYIYVYIWLGLLKHGNRNFSHIPFRRLVVEHNIYIYIYIYCFVLYIYIYIYFCILYFVFIYFYRISTEWRVPNTGSQIPLSRLFFFSIPPSCLILRSNPDPVPFFYEIFCLIIEMDVI